MEERKSSFLPSFSARQVGCLIRPFGNPTPHTRPSSQRVTQSSVLQEKLREQVEEEAAARLKAAEQRLVQRLMAVMDAVTTRLGSLEEKVSECMRCLDGETCV